ncbi:MAG: type 4a pilus biogenesis protein PilO [Phycisphaerales bacterium JB038]
MKGKNMPLMIGGTAVALLALSGLAVTYPALATMRVLEKEGNELREEIGRIEERTHSTQDLAAELVATQARFEAEFKTVPETPDVAGLIRKLGTFGEGDEEAHRQTLTTGQVQEEDGAKALPLILEARGSFLDAFKVIKRVEDLDRLARVRRITITRDPTQFEIIRATIQLDAFFAPAEGSVAAASQSH